MNMLVTGTAGFIGSHLVDRLLAEGHSVVGIDNLNSYYDVALKKERLASSGIDINKEITENGNYTFLHLDICDASAMEQLFSTHHFDKVIHLAAQAGVRYSIEQPQEYIQSNLVGFFNVLECCRKFDIRQLIYASSSSVYGNGRQDLFREDDRTDAPESLYAATKKSNELMAAAYHKLYGFSTIGLRFFTVYGPLGRPDMAPMLFADAILSGRPIKVFNNGQLWRDFTYIDDLVERLSLLVNKAPGNTCRVYNIGSSRPVLLNTFITTLEQALGREAQKDYLPMQPGDVLKTYASMAQFETDFGTAAITPFEQGIQQFADWFVEYYNRK